MSIFEEQVTPDNNGSDNNNNEQNNGQGQSQESQTTGLLDELVGEGKKFKTVEDLAKGKAEADRFIGDLQRQIDELKQDLSKSSDNDYAKQLLDQLKQQGTQSSSADASAPNGNAGTQTEGNTQPAFSENDINSLVEQALQKKEQEKNVQTNLQKVEQTLNERFGTEAQNMLKQKSQELGLTLEKMRDLASESPNAFLSLMGEQPLSQPQQITQGSVNTAALPTKNGEVRNNGYYQKLRRENKSLYYSSKVQRQMMEDAARMGDKFYK